MNYKSKKNPKNIKEFSQLNTRSATDKKLLLVKLHSFNQKYQDWLNLKLSEASKKYDAKNRDLLRKEQKRLMRFYNCAKEYLDSDKGLENVLEENLKSHRRTILNKNLFSKTVFYKIWKFFIKTYDDALPISPQIKPMNMQHTGPKKVTYVYSEEIRKALCDYYYNYPYNRFGGRITLIQIFCELRYEEKDEPLWKLLDKKDRSRIALDTLSKIIKKDKRWCWHSEIRYSPEKHPMRVVYMDLGYTQLDLKIIGRKDLPMLNHPIYIANIIDQGSKFAYSEVLFRQTVSELLEFYKRAYKYFKDNGITILKTRTDNAMHFKETNFVVSPEFHLLLKSLGVRQEHIPLGVSQANGQVENFNGKIDKELLPGLRKSLSRDDIGVKVAYYNEYHNFKRYHTNSINQFDPRVAKYIIPINFVQQIKKLPFEGKRYLYNQNIEQQHLSSEIDYASTEDE